MTEGEAQAWEPRRARAALNLTIDAHSARVVAALREAEVPALLLKGPVIAQRCYGRGEIRPYSDCDLLVRSEDMSRAEGAAQSLGLARDAAPELMLPEWERHAHSWVLPGRHFALELHWTLIHVGADPGTLWEVMNRDARPMRLGAVDVSTPADPQLAVILALHAAQHGGDWSRPKEDLRRALEVFPLEVWAAAARVAAEIDARPAFSAGLRLIPSGAAMATVLELPDEHSLEVWLTAGLAGQRARVLDRFVRAPGRGAKLRVALETAFPSPQRMRSTRRLAGRGRPGLALAYAMQPVYVIRSLVSGVGEWRRARRGAAPRDHSA